MKKTYFKLANTNFNMLPLMEMMVAPDKSEFFYPRRTEDDWEKKIF
ncbi:TPA: DNA mismatch repair protein MutT [Streptococcus pneumoniae]|nr:DNA mismatch repair protein MutT [Streptococcus pneumoniae]